MVVFIKVEQAHKRTADADRLCSRRPETRPAASRWARTLLLSATGVSTHPASSEHSSLSLPKKNRYIKVVRKGNASGWGEEFA
jgi:hypothetical protein